MIDPPKRRAMPRASAVLPVPVAPMMPTINGRLADSGAIQSFSRAMTNSHIDECANSWRWFRIREPDVPAIDRPSKGIAACMCCQDEHVDASARQHLVALLAEALDDAEQGGVPFVDERRRDLILHSGRWRTRPVGVFGKEDPIEPESADRVDRSSKIIIRFPGKAYNNVCCQCPVGVLADELCKPGIVCNRVPPVSYTHLTLPTIYTV